VEQFLQERGLELSPAKTVITHVEKSFDFLGQNVRKYPNGKLLIKPSKKNAASGTFVESFPSPCGSTIRSAGDIPSALPSLSHDSPNRRRHSNKSSCCSRGRTRVGTSRENEESAYPETFPPCNLLRVFKVGFMGWARQPRLATRL
jgi:hypothetical protein